MIHHDDQHPIAALASGHTGAAIAIIRVSGAGCFDLIKPCLTLKNFDEPRKFFLTQLVEPNTRKIIDEPMVVYFRGPRSYTGQDLMEIYVHGGPYIIKKALSLLYQQGIRAAQPGEFTRRAFLNDKMDLTTAEGIRELANASSESQWLAARQLASGALREEIERLRLVVLHAMALLEARIDFPEEEEVTAIALDSVKAEISQVQKQLESLGKTYQSGKIAKDGYSVALLGTPNAGKSTLLNVLLGEERAIVTEIAGTTRDYLEEVCLISGRKIRLIDTAGIRKSSNKVEQIGISRSLEIAKEADCILLLVPSDASEDERSVMETWVKDIGQKTIIRVLTKSDLLNPKEKNDVDIVISSHTKSGMDDLKNKLCALVDSHIAPLGESLFISTERHLHAIEQALSYLHNFHEAVEQKAYDEVLAFELRYASHALTDIIGNIDADQILDVVFSTFCIGK